jgi:hypothetical protein
MNLLKIDVINSTGTTFLTTILYISDKKKKGNAVPVTGHEDS